MATPAHCAYCFEVLTSSYTKKRPLSFDEVQTLWYEYEHGERDYEESEEYEQGSMAAEDNSHVNTAVSTQVQEIPTSYKPAAISRLLNPSTSSSGSSSSAPSAHSSTPSLNTASSASENSSRSSLVSSLPKQLDYGERRAAQISGSDEFPLFVSWNTLLGDGSTALRGCIGTFEPLELEEGLRSYALVAAFEDTRFNPISRRELPTLECDVTLLTDFETVSNPLDWTVGVHGLRISFQYGGRRYGSTYLPHIAVEQGWSREEAIISLMRKSGWSGRRSEWRNVKNLKVVRYQGKKATWGYDEWKAWKDWAQEGEDED